MSLRSGFGGRRRGGFTLLELVVVIIVLGLLALLAVPTFQSVTTSALDHRSEVELAAAAHDALANQALDQATTSTQVLADYLDFPSAAAAGAGVQAASQVAGVGASAAVTVESVALPAGAKASDTNLAAEMAAGSVSYGLFSLSMTSSGSIVGLAMRSAASAHCVGVAVSGVAVTQSMVWGFPSGGGCLGSYVTGQVSSTTSTTTPTNPKVPPCSSTPLSPPPVPAVWLPLQTANGTTALEGTADCSGTTTTGTVAPPGSTSGGDLPVGTPTPSGPLPASAPPYETTTAVEPAGPGTVVEPDPGAVAAIATLPSLDTSPPHNIYAAASNGDIVDVLDNGACGTQPGANGAACAAHQITALGAGVNPSAMVAGVAPDSLHPFGTFDIDELFVAGKGNGVIYEVNPYVGTNRVVATGFSSPTSLTGFACFNSSGTKVAGNCLDVGDSKGIWQVAVPNQIQTAASAASALRVGTLTNVTGLIYANDNGTAALAVATDNAGTSTLDTVAAGSGASLGSYSLAAGSAPAGMGNDPSDGLVYYADAAKNEVFSYNPTSPSTAPVVAAGSGSASFLDTSSPTGAAFNAPVDVHSHWVAGQYYVADSGNDAIRKVCLVSGNSCSQGVYTLWTAGTSGATTLTFGLAPGATSSPAAASSLNRPDGIAYANNKLWVQDFASSGYIQWQSYDPAAATVATVTGYSNGAISNYEVADAATGDVYTLYNNSIFVAPFGGGTVTTFSLPASTEGLTLGGDGNLYTVQYGGSGSAIWQVNPTTHASVKVMSNLNLGSGTENIVYSNGDMWVSQGGNGTTSSYGTQIQGVSTSTWATVASLAVPGSGTAGLTAIGPNLYVTANTGHAIWQVNESTGAYSAVAGGYANTFPTAQADGTGGQVGFTGIAGMTTDGTNLWVSDGSKLREVTATLSTPTGPTSESGVTVNDQPGTVSTTGTSFNQPLAEVWDAGKLWVADHSSSGYLQWQTYDPGTGVVATLASTSYGASSAWMAADPTYVYTLASNMLFRTSVATGNTEMISTPPSNAQGLTVGADGGLYTTVYNGPGTSPIYRIDPGTGAYKTVMGNLDLGSGAQSITYANGYMWVCQSWSTVNVIQVSTTTWTTTNTYAIPNPTNGPVVAAGSYLYLTTNTGHMVYQLNTANGALSLAAGAYGPGFPTAAADGTGPAASFSGVTGLASDGANLWVIDNGALRKIVPGSPLASGPTAGASTDLNLAPGAVTTPAGASFNQPITSVSDAGKLWVLDHVVSSGYIQWQTYDPATGTIATLGTYSSGATSAWMTADPSFVYTLTGNLLWRTSVTTGNTTQIGPAPSNAQGLTMAADGYLYSTMYNGASSVIYRIDPQTGVSTTVMNNLNLGAGAQQVAYANGALWVYQGFYATDLIEVPIASTFTAAATYAVPNATSGPVTAAGSYLYFSAAASHEILQFNTANATISAVAGGAGSGNPTAQADGTGGQASFSAIKSISSDGAHLWVLDSSELREAAPAAPLASGPTTGATTTLAAAGNVTSPAGASFNQPVASVWDNGVEYVLDHTPSNGYGQWQTYNPSTGTVATIASTTSGVSSAWMAADPSFVYTDNSGSLYRTSVANGNTVLVGSMPSSAQGLTVASDGYLYTTAYNGPNASPIYRIDPYTDAVTTVVNNLNLGAGAQSIAYANGSLWVYEGFSSWTLQQVSMSTWKVTATYTVPNYSSGPLAGAGRYLYLANNSNRALYQVDTTTGTATFVAGGSTAGSADGTGSAASFSNIAAISSDGSHLWVLDTGNSKLREVS